MRPFLTARWEQLLVLNYLCNPEALLPYLPYGTEVDQHDGKTYISLVGFMFLDTKVKGIAIPGHQRFPEVNLRFYVKRADESGQQKRGVVFIKEVVPKPLVTWVAASIYGEPYETHPMSCNANDGTIAYKWAEEYQIEGTYKGAAKELEVGSLEEFILEHYWGYTRHTAHETSEYEVRHPRWRYYECSRPRFTGDAAKFYGPEFGKILSRAPDSAFIAVGSGVEVFPGSKILAP